MSQATTPTPAPPAAIKVSIYLAGGPPIVVYLHAIRIWTNRTGDVTGVEWTELADADTVPLDHLTPRHIAAIKTRFVSREELNQALRLPSTSWLPD